MTVDADAQGDGAERQRELTGELPARPQVEEVVDRPEARRGRPTEEQCDEVGIGQVGRPRHPRRPLVEPHEGRPHEQEGGRDRKAAAACHGLGVDAPGRGMIHDVVAQDQPANEGRDRE